MKVLVFSDSHGCLDTMERAVRRESPDMILHLGDYVRDAKSLRDKFPHIPLRNVAGNCDFGVSEPETLLTTISGVRVFLTHGHRYYVKSMYLRAIYAAQEQNAGVLLFGHTHRAECFREGDLWVMNPGAAGPAGTYGIMELQDGQASCRLAALNGKDV